MALLLAMPVAAHAQPHPDAGRRAGTILRKTRPARAAALGGAVAAADQGVQAFWGNPAALLSIERQEVGLTRIQSYADISANMIAYGRRVGKNHAFAVGYTLVDYGAIVGRDLTGRPTGKVEAGNHIAGLSYAYQFNHYLAIGATGRFVNENLGRHSATTFTVDLGARVRTPIEGFTIGAAVQNLGGSLKFVSERYGLPRTWRVGATGMLMRDRLLLTGEAVKSADDAWEGVAALELLAGDNFILRAGGVFTRDRDPSLTTGFGFLFRGVTIDYAFIPRLKEIGDQHRVSLQVGF